MGNQWELYTDETGEHYIFGDFRFQNGVEKFHGKLMERYLERMNGGVIVVDCSNISHLDGHGLAELVRVYQSFHQIGCSVRFQNIPHPFRHKLEQARLADAMGMTFLRPGEAARQPRRKAS